MCIMISAFVLTTSVAKEVIGFGLKAMNTVWGMNNNQGAEEAQISHQVRSEILLCAPTETTLSNEEAFLATQFALLKLTLPNA